MSLHMVRIVMLIYRLTPLQLTRPYGIVFALLGIFEGVIGIIRLFNFKK
jgi:hypothetical protein